MRCSSGSYATESGPRATGTLAMMRRISRADSSHILWIEYINCVRVTARYKSKTACRIADDPMGRGLPFEDGHLSRARHLECMQTNLADCAGAYARDE